MSEETETMEPGTTDPDTAQADAAVKQQSPEEGYAPAEIEDENGAGAARQQQGDANLDVILDIPVTLSMEIGRTRVSIQDLLQLAKGSVVELDRMAGEPLDVLVNGTLVARGEVVVVNDKFGVRLNDVISPADRVQSIR